MLRGPVFDRLKNAIPTQWWPFAQSRPIPEMGGRRIGGFLQSQVMNAPGATAVVELGTWLGAGTEQLAKGLHARPNKDGIKIHCFDKFEMSEEGSKKAAMQGVEIAPGGDTSAWTSKALRAYSRDIVFHKGMLDETTKWSGEPISVYVDDATKFPHPFTRCLKIFGPSWIPGETVVILMDALVYLKKKPKEFSAARLADLKFQHDFVTERPESFTLLPGLSDTSGAAYRYEGGIAFDALPMPLSPDERRALKTSRIWR